jgi:predicted ATPase
MFYGSAALIEDLGDRALDVMAIIAEPDRQTPKQHDGDPEQLRFWVFDSVTAFLTNAARRQPLLLIIDDVHQADLASLALLDFLVPRLRTTTPTSSKPSAFSRSTVAWMSSTAKAMLRNPNWLAGAACGPRSSTVRETWRAPAWCCRWVLAA